MVLSQSGFINGKFTTHKSLCLLHTIGILEQLREVVELSGDVGMIPVEIGFHEVQSAAHQNLCLLQMIRILEQQCEVIERSGNPGFAFYMARFLPGYDLAKQTLCLGEAIAVLIQLRQLKSPSYNMRQKVWAGWAPGFPESGFLFAETEEFLLVRETVDHVMTGEGLQLGPFQGRIIGKEFELVAPVAPEVRGVAGQPGEGIFGDPKDNGAVKTFPGFAGTVEDAEGGGHFTFKKECWIPAPQ
jgi:hypothetical protein